MHWCVTGRWSSWAPSSGRCSCSPLSTSTAFSHLLTTAACSAQHEWGGHPKTTTLASMSSRNQESWLAVKQHWDQDSCGHSSLMRSAREQHLQGFVPSLGTGCSRHLKTIEGVLLSFLPPCCLHPPRSGGCLCQCPPPGYLSIGAMSSPFPWGSDTIWHRALKPPWSLWVGTAPAAPGSTSGSCPQTGSLQPAGGSEDKGSHGKENGGGTWNIHKAPNSSWGN